MAETWKPIPKWEGYYEVSDRGQVRSLNRVIETKTGPQRKRGKILAPSPDKYGYPRVSLFRNGTGESRRVHQLVLEAFVGPCPEGMESLHRDDNPANNRLENLRWGSRSENTFDKIENGNHLNASKNQCKWGHMFNDLNTRTTKRGTRSCKSCNRAAAYISRHGLPKSLKQRISDSYYAQLMYAPAPL